MIIAEWTAKNSILKFMPYYIINSLFYIVNIIYELTNCK